MTRPPRQSLQRSVSAWAGALLGWILLTPSAASAQTDRTSGDCSQIVHAGQGATVVINCVARTRKQLDDTQGEKRRVEQHLSETKVQLAALQAGLDRLQGDVHQLKQTDEQSPRILELELEISQRKGELLQKQSELDAEQALVLRAQQQIAAHERTLETYALGLRTIERERLTPDGYHWIGFSAALVGFGVATGFGLASEHQRSEIDGELERPYPTMTRSEAKDLARSIRTNNTIADVGLVVGLLGTMVGATYLWDLLEGETPGLEQMGVSAGAGEIAIHLRAHFGGAL